MPQLRLVAVDEDGSHLLLRAEDGEEAEFVLPIDERLHAALRGDRARLGQLEIQLESQLRPAEIQARVRAGEAVATVAQVAGVPVDRVLRFARPVLAEREHMAERARGCVVRRPSGEGPGPRLEAVVTDRLVEEETELDTLDWDSWRRDDGRWVVLASWVGGDAKRSARWTFDPAGRSVTPADDEARRMSAAPGSEQPAPSDPEPEPARLSVVPGMDEAEDDDTVPVPRVRATSAAQSPAQTAAAHLADDGAGEADLPDPADDSAGDSPAPAAASAGDSGGDRLRLSDLARRVEVEERRRPRRSRARSTAPAQPPAQPQDLDDTPAAGSVQRPGLPQYAPAQPSEPAEVAVASGQNRRPSVPSWDEIMFGRRRRPE